MNKFSLALLLAALAIAPQAAKAGFQGSISFTDDERAAHEQAVDQIESTAAACLARDLNHHKTFFQRYGFSPYYGDRGSFGKLSYEGKREYLRQNGFNPALLEQM
ncbi:MAG: hypothetical protein ACXVCI_17100, partial [Bdellovibrionota bacterium]